MYLFLSAVLGIIDKADGWGVAIINLSYPFLVGGKFSLLIFLKDLQMWRGSIAIYITLYTLSFMILYHLIWQDHHMVGGSVFSCVTQNRTGSFLRMPYQLPEKISLVEVITLVGTSTN